MAAEGSMKPGDDRVRDPVCGMRVDPDALAVEYQGMRFAFCSNQCRARFLANPGLYVGRPGRPAPRQRGQAERRRRRIRLDAPLDDAQARSVMAERLSCWCAASTSASLRRKDSVSSTNWLNSLSISVPPVDF